MKNIIAIVPAAGVGKRLGLKQAKPYLLIDGKPLLIYCLEVLENSNRIKKIILVTEKNNLAKAARIVRRFGIGKVSAIVAGGKTRSESVRNGLKAINENADFVIIHDGARPFINKKLIDRCIDAVCKYKAVTCAVSCTSTIKAADQNLNVIETLDRNKLWQVQTPQAFSFSLIKAAFNQNKKRKMEFFDDASLVESMGQHVKIVKGLYNNIKITTKEDLLLAKAILRAGNRG
ncbi:MAG: 2-C-methyl-D-erythritol 4-phosphate cytidylyltransferase [Candidatus Omnitrophica bacterium]|nr:2-C-methyl-D-erythritol 4-phosphate cytidylyltransferase [Candidatus Omnitrophota bacterium]